VSDGALVIVPLKDPYPFGVGKVLTASPDGTLDIQWFGNNSGNIRSPLYLGWCTRTGRNAYYADIAANANHRPYVVADDAGATPFHQRDVIMHSFLLNPSTNRLSPVILRNLAMHPEIWWDGTNDEHAPNQE
jgi:hypothetical protein